MSAKNVFQKFAFYGLQKRIYLNKFKNLKDEKELNEVFGKLIYSDFQEKKYVYFLVDIYNVDYHKIADVLDLLDFVFDFLKDSCIAFECDNIRGFDKPENMHNLLSDFDWYEEL